MSRTCRCVGEPFATLNFAEFLFSRHFVNGAERKDHGFYTTGTQPPNTSLQPKLALASLLSGLADPYPLPDDLLTPLQDVVPGVSSCAIRARATGDVVLAPIHRTDIVVATPTVAFVGAAAKVQRVSAASGVDAVSATVAVDSVTIRGAYKGVRSVIALDQCG